LNKNRNSDFLRIHQSLVVRKKGLGSNIGQPFFLLVAKPNKMAKDRTVSGEKLWQTEIRVPLGYGNDGE